MKNITAIVTRKEWHRGQGSKGSRLLVPGTGKLCCIGFLGRKLGLKDKEHLYDSSNLYDVLNLARQHDPLMPSLKKFIDDHYDTLLEAYDTNDDADISEKVRESTLKALGQRMHVRFIFRD